MTDDSLPQPLFSSDRLAERLGDATIKLVDGTCFLPTDGRNARAEYEAEHLPGAVFFDVDQICEPDTGLPHTWPSTERFSRAVGELGISNNDTVICYEAGRFMGASRVWWMFKAFGHERVAVLDGGLSKWKAEGRPLESGTVQPTPAQYQAQAQAGRVCNWREVMQAIESGNAQILDARSAGRFHATAPEPRPGLRGGHMPGALSLPFDQLLGEHGRYKSKTELEQVFKAAGLQADKPIITTCGSGVSAATLLLGLHLIEREDGILYDGSWSEWAKRDDTPIVTD